MRVSGRHFRSIWLDESSGVLRIIDQTRLPHAFELRTLPDLPAVVEAIRTMRVRGAPLIGAAAAHGLALALAVDPSDASLAQARRELQATRPTAVNLRWAIDRVSRVVAHLDPGLRGARAQREAEDICDEDVAVCQKIGEHGLRIIRELSSRRGGEPVRILTHCNAGWLATVDWGTALAPIYKAHADGLPVHVWVDETRPRNQGASLTAFELREAGVPHTVIVDNAGGHLMQRGLVDAVLVGSDRTTATGDVCNKIGTYLKALAATDNGVPFYVALPISTIDWEIEDGLRQIPIEERSADEVAEVEGLRCDGRLERVRILTSSTDVANPAFDVTPARHVTAFITERGCFSPGRSEMERFRPGERPD
ncbi:MAG: S-methyl-5-thioribose-1-phosphate isomerase [Spirochaetaceae bacterium]|nr:S-methyl-5-thioribose-1-phosphate isomerase [Spirochaetaceae bacterium]MCB9892755.1 S-methyl-5-thioribose-1-phosphate isomerase [Planctomycetota bacterium]